MDSIASTSKAAQGMVTAISSSLSKRSSPKVPPASVVYEPLVRSVLARGFVHNVLSISGAISWVLAAIWTYWQRGGISSLGIFGSILNWISPSTLLSAVLWWSLASVPIAVLRKSYLQATYSPSLSPRQTLFQHATERPCQYALVVSIASSACLTICHVLTAQTIEKYSSGDARLGMWAGSRKHPYHLNGNLCFLFLSQLTCALFYWFRDALRDRFSIRWSNQENLFTRPHPLSSSLFSTAMLSTMSTAFSLVAFALSRSVVLPILYRLPLVHSLLRPFVSHFLRPTYTISFLWSHIGLVIRAFFLTLTSHILWEVPSASFDTVFSLPVSAIDVLKDPGLVLVSAIHSDNGYFQLHAFRDLCLISSSEQQMVAKRAIIYNDSKYNPTLWSALVRRSLLLLGTDYQLFLRRGNPPQPVPAPQAPVVKKPEVVPGTPIMRTQIYKTPQATPIVRIADTFAPDSPVAGALASPASNSIVVPQFLTRPLRGHLLSRLPFLESCMSIARSNLATASHLVPWSLLPKCGSCVWWTRERRDRAAMRALPNRELDLMIIEVLSKMVGHSLQEDSLGYVQRDIPSILEALASFLIAVEEYQIELTRLISAKESSTSMTQSELMQLRMETAMAGKWLEGLSEGLRNGITLIIRIFGDRLAKYRFTPKTAFKLQTFADYM